MDAYYSALIGGLSALDGPLPQNQSDYQHIASVGAGNELVGPGFGSTVANRAKGCFKNGFVPGSYPELESVRSEPPLIVPCLRDRERLQVNALQKTHIATLAAAAGSSDRAAELERIFDIGDMEPAKIQAEFERRAPSLSGIVTAWQSTSLESLTLTSKGIALGYTLWQRMTEESAKLSVWLPD